MYQEVSDTLYSLANKGPGAMEDDDEDAADNALPALVDMFREGQLLRCSVVSIDRSTNRLELSMRPSVINASFDEEYFSNKGQLAYGCVRSIEDRGAIVSLGVSGLTGFLDGATSEELTVGQPVECVVSKLSKSRALTLSIDEKLVSKARQDTSITAFSALLPGSCVNGIVTQQATGGYLLDILGDFTALVDRYHNGGEAQHATGSKLKARVLCADENSKVCYLTLDEATMDWETTPLPTKLKIGTVIQDAVVTKVDQGIGLRLALPVKKAAKPFPAYCHISKISDQRLEKITGDHGEGTEHSARVIAFNRLDGVAIVTLQSSVIDEPLMNTVDVEVGEVYKGVVKDFNKGGLRVQLSKNVIGFVPMTHLSDSRSVSGTPGQAEAKYRPGTKMKLRALRVDEDKRSVVLTHRRSLVGSELACLSRYEDAVPGEAHMGVVITVKDVGAFVTFYGGVKGFIPATDYTSAEQQPPAAGDALLCYVKNCNVENERLRLTLHAGDASENAGHLAAKDMATFDTVELGEVRQGKVLSLVQGAAVIDIGGGVTGTLSEAHLSDHKSVCGRLKEALEIGNDIGEVLVLRKDHERRRITLTRKATLIAASQAGTLVGDAKDVEEGDLLSGYVKSVSKHGAFVGMLGDLTGLAHKSAMADAFVADPSDFFQPGDSVRMSVLSIEDGRMKVSTKVSDCGIDAEAHVKSYFHDEELVLKLKQLNKAATEVAADDSVWKQLALGATAEGQVYTVADYGVVLSLVRDVVGFVKAEHADGDFTAGEVATGRILDVSRDKGIVDLSLLESHTEAAKQAAPVSSPKKKRKAGMRGPSAGQKTEGTVELVKDDYLVLSLPEHNLSLCYAASRHPNETSRDVHAVFKQNQKVSVTIGGTVGKGSAQRLLATVHEAKLAKREKKPKTESSGKDAKLSPGDVVEATVTGVTATHAEVALEGGGVGKVHISELPKGKKLSQLDEDEEMTVRILASQSYGKTGRFYEVTGSEAAIKADELPELITIGSLKVGASLKGWVETVEAGGMWVSIAPGVRGQVRAMDASEDTAVVTDLRTHFKEGMCLKACRVIMVDGKKNRLDLTLLKASSTVPRVGAKRAATITKIDKKIGLNVKLAGGIQGRIFLTDISDDWQKDALKGFQCGQVVEGVVVEVVKKDGGVPKVDMSLRESKMNKTSPPVAACPDVTSALQLEEGQVVQGYITNISAKGCFVAVSRGVTARVKISELADKYLENLPALFPPGKLVEGRVLTIDRVSERVEMSLKHSVVRPSAGLLSFSDITPGMHVKGTVKKVQSFGVFVNIADSNLSGLAHLSELSEQHVEDPKQLFTAGDAVKAYVLRTDATNQHISLSLKSAYFTGDAEEEEEEEDENEEEEDEEGEKQEEDMDVEEEEEEEEEGEEGEEDEEDEEEDIMPDDDENSNEEEEEEEEEDEDEEEDAGEGMSVGFKFDGFADLQGPPVDEEEEAMGVSDEEEEEEDGDAPISKSKKRREKQRAKEEEEKEIREREAEALGEDRTPQTVDDYEKLLLAYPDSAFSWIKYMSYQLSLADVDKARQVAERALDKIRSTKEEERLKLWVAWLNLEFKYGEDGDFDELVQRAANSADPKLIYTKVLDIKEHGGDAAATEELYKSVTKKFKTSSTFWLRFCLFKLKAGNVEGARKVLQRSLLSLPKRKHIATLAKFAQFEFKYGSAERGRTMFDSLMGTCPKRLDLWSIWLDMEESHGEEEPARKLFERTCAMKWSSKKMKFLLKRYLSFEKANGSREGINRVKEIAASFVESKTTA